MDPQVEAFLEANHGAVMVTVRPDGSAHVARVGVGLVDGKLWSSGTATRVRTSHLRNDDRYAMCVLDSEGPWRWLGIEGRVRIREGKDAPQENLALYRALAGEPADLDEYMRAMVEEERLIYEFSVDRAYGSYG